MNRWIKFLVVAAVLAAVVAIGTTQATAHPRWGVAVVGPAPYYYGPYYAPIPRRAFYPAPVVPMYRPARAVVVPAVPYYAPVVAPAPVYYGW
jgi:hypothetical protein